MQTADEHKRDEQIKRIMREYPLEEPEAAFTDRFMDRLEQEVVLGSVSAYSPLISFRTGVVITVLCAALVIAATTMELPQSLLSFRLLDLISIEWEGWNDLTAKIGTSIMIYAMIFLIIGLGIQFHYLKRWHARQIYTT